jgi:uncharacterized caspase-like protein
MKRGEIKRRRKQKVEVDTQLPLVVEIISPSDNSEIASTEITVRFRVRTPSGEPVTNIKALIDGRPTGLRNLVLKQSSGEASEFQIIVPERDSTLSIIAENRFSASMPASLRLRWTGRSTQIDKPTPKLPKPKLYVLAIGISRYANSNYNLRFSSKDAQDFVAVLQKQSGGLYRDVVIKLLVDEHATKDEILDGLDWIRKETTSNDVAMVFLSGHGINDANNYYFFLPTNADIARLLRTGVAFSDLRSALTSIAGKAILFVDTAHSGNIENTRAGVHDNNTPIETRGSGDSLTTSRLLETQKSSPAKSDDKTNIIKKTDITLIVNELASVQNGIVVFSASTGSQYPIEDPAWTNGAFTKALVEGLNGKAALNDSGKITVSMLHLYVSERVRGLTEGKQATSVITPQTVPDFPIALNPDYFTTPNQATIIEPLKATIDLTRFEPFLWEFVKESNDSEDLNFYLKKFPKGLFVDVARARLSEIMVRGLRIASAPADWKGPTLPSMSSHYHALVIGIDNYKTKPLKTAVNDARAVAAILEHQFGFKVMLLPDATRRDIILSLIDYMNELDSNTNLLIYYAGHGVYDGGKAYWLPIDADTDPTNHIIEDEITSRLRNLRSTHILIIVDSCYSGTFADTRGNPDNPNDVLKDIESYLLKLDERKSRTLMTSGRDEPVADGGGGKHSVFAKALLDGLNLKQGHVFSANDLFKDYIVERVAGNAPVPQLPLYKYLPGSGHDFGDFLFIRRKK